MKGWPYLSKETDGEQVVLCKVQNLLWEEDDQDETTGQPARSVIELELSDEAVMPYSRYPKDEEIVQQERRVLQRTT